MRNLALSSSHLAEDIAGAALLFLGFFLCLVPILTGAGGTSSSVDSLKNLSKLVLGLGLHKINKRKHKIKLTEVSLQAQDFPRLKWMAYA